MLFPGGGDPQPTLEPLYELVTDVLGRESATISGIVGAPQLHSRSPSPEDRYCKIFSMEILCCISILYSLQI